MDKKVFRDVFIRFRMGISDLFVHKQRYITHSCESLCPLCRENDEDEDHFMFKCPALEDVRERYLCPFLTRSGNDINILFNSDCKETTRSTSIFLYKAFSRRACVIKSPEENFFFLEF